MNYSSSSNGLSEGYLVSNLIPVDNYFSGHDLEFDLTLVGIYPEACFVEITDYFVDIEYNVALAESFGSVHDVQVT